MPPTRIPTFVQRSRLGKKIFQIRNGVLEISTSRLSTGFAEHRFDLQTLDPDYQPRTGRLHILLILGGVGLVLSLAVLWGLQNQTVIPREAVPYFSYWPGMMLAVSLGWVVYGTRRVEYYVFCNHWKKPAFDIVREPAQTEECTRFILALVEHIKLAQSDLPAAERQTRAQAITSELLLVAPPPPIRRKWKLSILCGVLACGLPLIPGLANLIDPLLELIVFALCAGSAAWCYFSFDAREPHRWWSLVGAGLSAIPVFFY